MHETIELIFKITAVILSFAGGFCLLMLYSRGAVRLRPAADDSGEEIYSFLVIDVNKTGENTDMLVAGINKDISSGKVDYIHKILLLEGADIDGFIERIGNTAAPDDSDIEKMCGIITEKYNNILYLKK